jgi:sterol 24-C-methyltransferase
MTSRLIFYEYAWGQSFHAAPRYKNESLAASLTRFEHYIGLRLGLAPGMKVLDVGCGVGGPMRTIARFTGASITGVNINNYQISRGKKQNEQARLSHLCDFMKADFMKIPVADKTYDAIYSIEAIPMHLTSSRCLPRSSV